MTPGAEADDREIVTECELDAKPETVWRTLTVPDLIGAWLLPLRDDRHAGGFALDGAAEGLGARIDCALAECRPNETVSYHWREEDRDDPNGVRESLVTFEISASPSGGTRLRIVHGALRPVASEPVMIAANCNLARTSLRAA